VIGRGVRQQRAQGAAHRASILLHFDARGELEAALDEQGVERHLKLAGHRLARAESRAQLAERLAGGGYDIVVAALSERAAVESALGDGAGRALMLPVIHNPTGEELAQAQSEWSCVMRSPNTKKHYLAVIEEAMLLRHKREKP
jgi:uncharacterized protein YbjT (DUF2867 family)